MRAELAIDVILPLGYFSASWCTKRDFFSRKPSKTWGGGKLAVKKAPKKQKDGEGANALKTKVLNPGTLREASQ